MPMKTECSQAHLPAGKKRRAGSRETGYSMMEILIVLAIMAVIASLVGPSLFNQLDKSKITAAKTQIKTLESSLTTLRLEIGRFPTEAEGLSMLVAPPSDPATRDVWRGPYLDDEIPLDPWGNAYRYAIPPSTFEGMSVKPVIYSLGQDNKPGGEGMDADIGRVNEIAENLRSPPP